MNKKLIREELMHGLAIIVSALISAIGLHVFVYPSDFAPSGVDGIATILQELTGWNAGIFNFAINLPLLAVAYFILKKRYVIYTVAYTGLTSFLLVLFEQIELYQYVTDTDMILPAIFGGIAQGLTSLMLRIGGSAGGVDVLACMIQKRAQHRNVESIISFISYIVVGISYFVWWDLNSIMLSIVEIFVCERITAYLLRDRRNAIKFEIVTPMVHVDAIKNDILHEMHRAATVLEGHGMYSNDQKQVIICLVNYRQIPTFLNVMKKYPDTFLYYADVMGVRGNFDWQEEKTPKKKRRKRHIPSPNK